MIGLLLLLIWLLASLYALETNRDVFSPTKFYFIALFIFFADIFVSDYPFEIYLTYLAFILIGLIAAILEGLHKKRRSFSAERRFYTIPLRKIRNITILLWIISLVPIMAQIHLIRALGGIEQYVNSIGFRVLEWSGLGYVTTVIKVIGIINIFYFGLGLVAGKKHGLSWWATYFLHLLIFVSTALLSGSRGTLLMNFLVMAIMYHYLRRSISLKIACVLAISLFVIAILLGTAREGYKWTDGSFQTGLTGSKKKLLNYHREIKYGLIPLELVYSRDTQNLKYGFTFVTAITNFVPRKWWPGKPDTGGVILTKTYAGDAWGGATNLAPGIIAESIINFGHLFGTLFGFALLLAMLVLTVELYWKSFRIAKETSSVHVMVIMVSYVLLMLTTIGLLYGEFTNSIVVLITKLVPLWLVYFLAFKKADFRPRSTRDRQGAFFSFQKR